MSFRDMNTPETPLTDPIDVLLKLEENYRSSASLFTHGSPRRPDIREDDLPRVEREFFGGHYNPLIGRHTYYVSREAVLKLEDLGALEAVELWNGDHDYHERKASQCGKSLLWEHVGYVNRTVEGILALYAPPIDPSTYCAE